MLTDIHFLEASLQYVKLKSGHEQKRAVFYYDQLFSSYHMTSHRFRVNFEYYQSDPEKFSLMYEEVKKGMDFRLKMQKTLNAKRKQVP